MILTERACGKLNLTLDVLGKRPDGYHELRTVMASVELHDTVTLEIGTGRPWEVTCDRGEIPQGEGNLCWKAAGRYFDTAGIAPEGLRIQIEKRVPAQAGMAGGSGDAAAVLRALNRHYGAFSAEALRGVGLQVGSDVPYCLFGGLALAEGRGERLTRLTALPEGLCFVLVQPSFCVATPRLFAALDTAQLPSALGTDAMLTAIESRDAAAIGAALSNDFAKVLAREHPVVETVKRELVARGALGSELTGTGSVIFGLFDDARTAQAAAAALQPKYSFVTVTTLCQ